MNDDINTRIHLTSQNDASPAILKLAEDTKKLVASLKALANVKVDAIGSGAGSGIGRDQIAAMKGLRERFTFESRMARQRAAEGKAEERRRSAIDRIAMTGLRERLAFSERMHRQRLAEEKEVARERQRARDVAVTAARRTGRAGFDALDRGTRAGAIGAGIISAGAAATIRSLTRSAVSLDTAEAMASIHAFSEKTADDAARHARELRKTYAIPEGIRMGVRPADMLGGLVEAAQAGVPDDILKDVTTLGVKYSKLMGTTLPETLEDAGKALTVLRGMGKLTGPDGARMLFNVVGGLAGQTAASRTQMMSFARTGIGAGAQLGMSVEGTLSFGAAMTSVGAQGAQAARMLTHIGTDLAELTLRERDVRRKHSRSAEDRLFLEAPSLLGFQGGYAEIEQRLKKSPDDFIFDLIGRLRKIPDPIKRLQVQKQVFGNEFGSFLGSAANAKDVNLGTLALAKRLAGQAEGQDYLTGAWEKWTRSFEFFLDQVSATYEAIKAELGDTLKPFADELRQFVTQTQGSIGNLQIAFSAGLRGFLQGLGSRDGSLSDLLRSWFGDPSKAGLDANKIQLFFRGFGEGLKGFFTTIATLVRSVSGNGDPERIGKLASELLAFSTALRAVEPVVSVLTAVGQFLLGIGAVAASVLGLKKLGGLPAAGAAAGGGWAVVGTAIAAAFVEYLKGSFPDFGKPSKQDIERMQRDSVMGWIWNKLFRKSGYESSEDQPRSLLQKASFDRLERTLRGIDESNKRTGGLIQLASLGGGSGIIGAARSFGGGSAGGFGGTGGGAGALENANPGQRLPSFGMGSGGIIRKGAMGSLSGGSRSWRNSNPGNIKFGAFARSMGATHADEKGFAVFPDYATGRKAQEQLLFGSKAYSGLTVGEAIRKWAPASDGNDPAGYAAQMAKAAGVGVNTPMASLTPDQRKRFLDAQQAKEGWTPGNSGSQVGAGEAGRIKGFANLMHGQYGAAGQNLTTITTPSGKKVTVHAAAAESFKGFLGDLEASGYKINSIGGFAMRNNVNNGSRLSQHAYGNAIDINPAQNPNQRGATSDNMITNLPKNVSDMAARWGLSWGGDWKSVKDTMHFEWAGSQPWKGMSGPQKTAANAEPKRSPFYMPPDAAQQVAARARQMGEGSFSGWKPGPGGNAAAINGGESMLRTVPTPPPRSEGMGGPGGSRMAPQVHINVPGAGDPEMVAKKVQDHINKHLPYRSHDVDHWV